VDGSGYPASASRASAARIPDQEAPVIRNSGGDRELIKMRWGMPPPPKFGGAPVTNIRNT
jgi:putative SOS response-associated peptidase YedK